MKVIEAVPEIFKRTYPILEPRTQMLLAVSLLRFHQIDALPIGLKQQQRIHFAVFGYSCLSSLLGTKPKNYRKFLEMPCEKASLKLTTIRHDETLESLFQLFGETRFGFAWIKSPQMGAFASLRDIVALYGNGSIQSDLKVGEVASPIFSMPKGSTLKQVLKEMFEHHFRRIFIDGQHNLVTDRRIIDYIFSSARLNTIFEHPETLLDANLGDLEKTEPIRISSKASLKTAALSMKDSSEECLICEEGVVTPWDLIMKPREMKRLKIKL